MTTLNPHTKRPARGVEAQPQGLVQRCACGGVAGPAGECAACRQKREASEGGSDRLSGRLKIAAPDGQAEVEANQTAALIMGRQDAPTPRQPAPASLQRLPVRGAGIQTAPPVVQEPWRSAGSPLNPGTRAFMEPRFGHDFSGVRVHAGAEADERAQAVQARAYTVGHEIAFGAGEYGPASRQGQTLLAHELTHVVQQDTRPQQPTLQRQPAGMGDVHLAEARDAEEARQKALLFDRLRSQAPSTDAGLRAEVEARFAPGTDDRWLAETILRSGPEPRWSLADITERQKRAMANNWASEPGNIGAVLGGGSHTVQAFYFRGTTDRRALIVGGVHGSEPGGVEVVNDLLTIMRAPNAPTPLFTVIIVPELFAANVHSSRRSSGGRVRSRSRQARNDTEPSPDPNRQFPAVGADPAPDAALGCIADEQHRCIEPENLVLLDLINRFQPERVANVHGHSEQSSVAALLANGGPSITTDPRAGHEREDDALTLSMAAEAQRMGVRVPANFIGSPQQTTRYPNATAPRMSTGVSFGQWGSNSTPTRPAMNIVLIETFGNTTSNSRSLDAIQQASRRAELMSLAQILRNFFLGQP